jgi:hypothetical protein
MAPSDDVCHFFDKLLHSPPAGPGPARYTVSTCYQLGNASHLKPTEIPAMRTTLISLLLALGALAATPAQAQTQTQRGLGTQPGEEVGVSVSSYKYAEPGVMDLNATKLGIDYTLTQTFPGTWPNRGDTSFFTGEFRLATGDARYSNVSGVTGQGLTDWYWEARALAGVDIEMDGYVLAPYLGLGYRYLYNDLRNLAGGYRRETRYLSIPMGVTVRMRADAQSQLLTTFEYIHLLSGTHDARLSDASLQDVSLNQRNGSGLRLKVIRQFPTWSIGPTLTYWRVGASNSVAGWVEPKNNTVELGVSIKRRF